MGQGRKKLDFGSNLDPDPGNFKRIFTAAVLAMVKSLHYRRGSNPIMHRLAYLRLNKLKADLAEVCAV